jgi:hypothetical protein
MASTARLMQEEALATVPTLHKNLRTTQAARIGAVFAALADPAAGPIGQRAWNTVGARNLVELD